MDLSMHLDIGAKLSDVTMFRYKALPSAHVQKVEDQHEDERPN
jgi:hypothetical protein